MLDFGVKCGNLDMLSSDLSELTDFLKTSRYTEINL